MPAYLIIEGEITDRAKWAAYRAAVLPLIVRFGGTRLTQGAGVRSLEGRGARPAFAMFEFATPEAIERFWHSPDYQPVKALRQGAADLDIFIVEGHPRNIP